MAFQQVPDTAESVVRFSYQGRIMTMSLYAYKVGGYDSDDLINLAGLTDVWAGSLIVPILSSSVTYVDVQVRGLDLENDLTAETNANSAVGDLAVVIAAPQATFAVKRLSGLTGRSARGRVYVPPPATSQLNTTNKNLVTAGFADNWVTYLNAWDAAALLQGWLSVIVSRYTNGAKRFIAATFPVTTWAYTNLILDTQRRRLPEE